MKHFLKISLAVVAIAFYSCSKPISAEDLKHLNGYWEISEVKTSDGDNKEYQSNNNVDLFVLEGTNGTRSKVVATLDGKIGTNGIKETFVVKDSAGATYLKYQTDFSKWTEKIEKLSADELVIINENNIKYSYKRFTPININE